MKCYLQGSWQSPTNYSNLKWTKWKKTDSPKQCAISSNIRWFSSSSHRSIWDVRHGLMSSDSAPDLQPKQTVKEAVSGFQPQNVWLQEWCLRNPTPVPSLSETQRHYEKFPKEEVTVPLTKTRKQSSEEGGDSHGLSCDFSSRISRGTRNWDWLCPLPRPHRGNEHVKYNGCD